MRKAYFILILHVHLPFVMDIMKEDSLEERWLYEALCDCYLRLIQVFDRLMNDNVPFDLTISLSPTILAQLENPRLKDRFRKFLKRQIRLTESEIRRTSEVPEHAPIVNMYKDYYLKALETFEKRCDCDMIRTFKSYQDQGLLEIITCAATHAYLPLLKPTSSGIRAQINVARKEYDRIFEKSPSGFWLPECGYFPDMDRFLLQAGIQYTFLDTQTILSSSPIPKFGTYAPIISPSGLISFGRDFFTAKEVWSAIDGYPGDMDYRDFYRDIGYDLNLDYIGPYLPGGTRCYTGLKYYGIGKRNGMNQFYDPVLAEKKVSIHSDDFLAHRLRDIRDITLSLDFPPVICAFYDAELFGHWWFEGPLWLEMLFRKLSECKEYIEPITPNKYLSQRPMMQKAQPPSGSWGWKGHNEVWLNEKNQWVYPHLFKAGEKMNALAQRDDWKDLEKRALNQAGKELMLAQSSDWTFILHNQTLTEYATKRIKNHLGRFWRLVHQIEKKAVESDWLQKIEKKDDICPSLSYKDFS